MWKIIKITVFFYIDIIRHAHTWNYDIFKGYMRKKSFFNFSKIIKITRTSLQNSHVRKHIRISLVGELRHWRSSPPSSRNHRHAGILLVLLRLHPSLIPPLGVLRCPLRLRDAGKVRFPQGHPPGGRGELYSAIQWRIWGSPLFGLRVQGKWRVLAEIQEENHRESGEGIDSGTHWCEREGPRLVQHQSIGERRCGDLLLCWASLGVVPYLQLRGMP